MLWTPDKVNELLSQKARNAGRSSFISKPSFYINKNSVSD